MSCSVFHLIPTSYKSDYIWSIVRTGSIKGGFMRVNSQIFNADIETLWTSKSRGRSLVFQMGGCVTNANSNYKRNVMYQANSMSKCSMIFHLCLTKGMSCSCKGKYLLLFVCIFCPKSCINLSKFSIWEPLIY